MFGAASWGALAWGDYPKVAVVVPVVPPPTPTPTPTPAPPPPPAVVGQVIPPATVGGGGNTWGFSGLDDFYRALDDFYEDLRREQAKQEKKKKRRKKKQAGPMSPLSRRLLPYDPALIRVAPPRFDSEAEDLFLLGFDLYFCEEEAEKTGPI
jgi:hypothetical protein